MPAIKPIEVSTFLSHDVIERKIYLIRGKKVMFDKDLSSLYGVSTGYLNRQVRRHPNRFPSDFMFQLTVKEFKNLICQFGTSSWGGARKRPLVFTEHGILMLSSILNAPRAILVNIQIMRTFTKIREFIFNHKKLQRKIEELERKYDTQFRVVFDAIKEIEGPIKQKQNRRIGFHS
jgi:hypothetical protein